MSKKTSYGDWIKWKIHLLHSNVTSLSYTAKPTGWEKYVLSRIQKSTEEYLNKPYSLLEIYQ